MRRTHYAILIAAHLLMTLPNLGAHSLWDMDEGINAEAAREMLESGNWITPYFNYELRTGKPAMMYWFIALCYQVFGVNEFAARLPSVLFGLGTILVTYELSRRMFSASTGLISALALASCLEFCLISHAATPDPPLLFFLTLSMFIYWVGSQDARRWWFIPFGAVAGLSVLTKGPVGLALPGLIILGHLCWTRQLRKLWDSRLLLSFVVFVLVAGPWYGLVTLDTKGRWLHTFLLEDNIRRFGTPAQSHSGGPLYHVLALVVLFAPWSVFLPAAVWYGIRASRRSESMIKADSPDAYRFLLVWIAAYLVVFTVAATKLPNYILPLYPAVAMLAGRFLDRWRLGDLPVPRWVMTEAIIATGALGVLLVVGVLVASGVIPLPMQVKGFRPFASLASSAAIGAVPFVAALLAGYFVKVRKPTAALGSFAAGAVVLVGFLAAVPTVAMQEVKVPKHFAEEAGLRQTDRDIRIASCRWLRHSMVFYARREITRIDDFRQVNEFMALPRPAFLLVPDDVWEFLSRELTVPVRVIARRYDFYARRDVLVVVNDFVQ